MKRTNQLNIQKIGIHPTDKNKLRLIYLGTLLLFLFSTPVFAQNGSISGLVKSEDGEVLPYANVIILGKSVGTSTNFDGEYSLPLEAGTYRISFQFVGYKTRVEEIALKAGESIKLNVELSEEKLLLDMVVVRPNGENPAYRIIREAQENKKKYLNENKNIAYNAYTKLFGRCSENRSSSIRFLGTLLEPMKGIFYLSESVTEIYQYTYEQKTEELTASLMLNENEGYSKNNSNFIELYRDYPMSITSGVISNRVISPLAKEAFTHYDYELKGTIEENGLTIHKIAVIPLTKNGITFEGDLYIIDGSWRLYKVQVSLDNPLLGNFEINNTYIEVEEENAWIPFSCSIILKEDDDELSIYYHSIYYDFQFDKAAPEIQKQANYIVGDSLLSKDSIWWANTRPIELTTDEQNAYFNSRVEKEQQSITNTNQVDSLNTNSESSTNGLSNNIMQAFRTNRFSLSKHLSINGNIFSFNTIEGGVLKPGLFFTAKPNQKELEIDLSTRYGFASNTFYAKSSLSYELSLKHLTKILVEGGSYVEEISGNESISEYWNMIYSLFKQNYKKLYQKNYALLAFQTELFNGLDFSTANSFAVRYPLQNNSSYNWSSENSYNYTPNQALIDGAYLDFQKSDLWETSIMLSYKHKRRFNLIQGKKIPLSSKFPLVRFKFDLGLLDAEYTRFCLNIKDSWSLGRVGISTLSASYGDYLSSSNLTPIDLFHFMGNQTFIYQAQPQYGLSYQLLDYYTYSTSNSFIGANFEHDFNSFLFGKVAFLKKIGLKSYLMANYLQVSNSDPYSEIGIGLSSSYLPIQFNYHFGFKGDQAVSNGFTMIITP